MTVPLTAAALAVIAERTRQVECEGCSHADDDLYTAGQLADAASVYARLADQPDTRSTQWPWPQETYKPTNSRRRNLVMAGALILAEIERLDRVPLSPAPVDRDAQGWWTHPEFLSEYDDEITTEEYKAWCARKRIETSLTFMSSDAPEDINERYGNEGDCSCADWVITPHPDAGWFAVSIHDTEDGPVCVWARRVDQ
jgi:hypothetical protein